MNDYINSGERLSFAQLLVDNTISIPLIQRDYVQGRVSEDEVRTEFLNALINYLKEGTPFRDLDFIYGFLNENKILYPLDGQQRLTTLMLLHWFLANKESKFNQYKQICTKEIEGKLVPKFSYENRVSSKEFCNELFSRELDFSSLLIEDANRKNSMSKTIRNYNWYASVWDYDPTIQNILNMLDAMHHLFLHESNFFEALVNQEKPIITFLFMDLGKNNLSDDLYIKMNARGVQLTPYENFKAKLEKYITTTNFNQKFKLDIGDGTQDLDFKTYYTYKLDGEWSNMVWNILKSKDKEINHPEKFDVIWTNIFRVSFLHSLLKSDYNDKEVQNVVRELLTNSKPFSYYEYTSIITNSKEFALEIINQRTISEFVDLLNSLDENGFSQNDFDYFSSADIFYDLILSDYKTAKYVERLLFFSYTEYLLQNKGKKSDESLKSWMRLVRNLIYNTAPYDNIQGFLNSVKAINELVKHSEDIDAYLEKIDFYDIIGFDTGQFKEEILKRRLEKRDSSWKGLIRDAELHPYLEGQLNFILMLCGIENDTIDGLFKTDAELQNIFGNYFRIFKELFNAQGLNQDYSKNGEYRFERALLSLGDYTLQEGNNKSFLINRDRDISWKRFLKFDKKTEHKQIIKSFFENLFNSSGSLKNDLQRIIDEHCEVDIWWRYLIVNNAGLLDYFDNTKKRYFREKTNHGFVFLKGERVSGAHAELESYNFYLNENNRFNFIEYYSVSGENNDDIPCTYLDVEVEDLKYGIDVRFINEEFNIAVKKRSLEPYNGTLSNLLVSESFSYNDYFSKNTGDYETTNKYLATLIEKIKIIKDNQSN
ncbi:MAG: DUF262 domain-containing protein [Bacteroidota bacterium]